MVAIDSLNALKSHTKGKKDQEFASLYLILAKESFDRRAAEACLTSGAAEGMLQIFEGASVNPGTLEQEFNSFSFWGARSFILLRDVHQAKTKVIECLKEYCQHPESRFCVVLSASSLSSTKLLKLCKENGIFVQIPDPKPWERDQMLVKWLMDQAKTLGKQLPQDVAQGLLGQSGRDKTFLNQELKKLACYVGDEPVIDREAVKALSVAVNEDTIWQLGDALMKSQQGEALRIGMELMHEGLAFPALMAQVRSQLQNNFRICSLLHGGASALDVQKEFPYLKGRRLETRCSMVRSYGLRRFRHALLQVQTADLQFKNSLANPDLLWHRLMGRLAVNKG